MDALILSCGTGGGHNSAGRAIAEELRRRGDRAVMLNPYTLHSPRLAETIDNAYIRMAQHAPHGFGAVYKIGDLYRRLPVHSPVYFANLAMMSALRDYLAEHRFDVVFMPHVFPAEILTGMRRHGFDTPKTIFIATDYVCIPFTEETECDAYIVPTPALINEFASRGIPLNRLYPLGIPTSAAFSEPKSPDEAKRSLGLDPQKRYILVSGGSIGAGEPETAVETLFALTHGRGDAGIIVVCGNNEDLFRRLSERFGGEVTVVGHTDRMADYLRASSLYFTKPGGLSSTEAAVCGVPLAHISPIPGCETCNAEYFSERGMSVACDMTEASLASALSLLDDGAARDAMLASQRREIPPSAAARICDLAERLVRSPERVPRELLPA